MPTYARRLLAMLLGFALLVGQAPAARAAVPASEDQGGAIGRTPPRLSFTSGEASFWRPGADDWAPAQVNTPLAPGDELYTGHQGNLELQVGARAFVRAWGDTQLGLVNLAPDLLQLKATAGHVSLDLRGLDEGRRVELDTPQAVFTIEQPGYYRADLTQDRISFITRRGGHATMTSRDGRTVAVTPSEEVILEGAAAPSVQSYVAPEPDAWDTWNSARTNELLDAVSSRYVPAGVYGVDDLDHHGNWRVVPTYGAVWVPEAASAGWVPYSTGKWILDPSYGWSWVDTAPWGWAPYHYGRWVFVDGFWAWAPGPIVRRPVYAPALVAFFGGPGVRVGIGVPAVSWVALGWGEPLVPWWGRPTFAGRPWWGGWGGPRLVNNVVVDRGTVVNVSNVTVWRNATVQNAVVTVNQEHFGRRPVQDARIGQVDARRLEPVRGALRVTPDASSFVGAAGRGARPPESTLARPVVATRPPVRRPIEPRDETRRGAPPVVNAPAPTIVAPARAAATAPTPQRPPFGASPLERTRPVTAPRFEPPQRPEPTPQASRERAPVGQPAPAAEHRSPVPATPPARSPEPVAPQAPAQRSEPQRPAARPLPGEPANRLFPGRAETPPRRSALHPAPAPQAAPAQHAAPHSAPARERRSR